MVLTEYKGDWALVTGASAGIGHEFARQLAAAGMNLVLVARRQQRLDELAEELRNRHGIATRVLVADLTLPDEAARIKSILGAEGCRIRLLCNNAAYGQWGRFENASALHYQGMLQLNMGAMVSMCHAFLIDLRSFPTSAVINVSSAAAYQPVPYMAVYAATKAFVLNFSQALYGEWKEQGILVQTLIPGPTETEFDVLAGAYPSALESRGSAVQVVSDSLIHLEKDSPVALSAKGTLTQRLFVAMFQPRFVIKEVAKRFKPPQ